MQNERTMYEAMVFDLDGTLLDTLDDLTDAVNASMREVGLKERTKEEVRGFVGNGIVKLIERAVGGAAEKVPSALAYFKAYYAKHCADKTKPYEGILSLLQILFIIYNGTLDKQKFLYFFNYPRIIDLYRGFWFFIYVYLLRRLQVIERSLW